MAATDKKLALQKAKFILGIDGGGTKTIARLVNLTTQEQWQASAGSSSLSNDFSGAINVLDKLIKEVTTLSQCQLKSITAVFGLAGAGSLKLVASLQQVFASRFAQLEICSDAKTSAYGANNGDEVAVVALGTGSVGMRLQYNESGELTHHLVGGWGFLIGDEGGGAKLGYHGVQTMIAEFQQYGKVRSQLAQTIASSISTAGDPLTRHDIASWLAGAKPADFAQLSPLVFQFQQSCSVAKKLLSAHAIQVQRLIDDTRAQEDLPVVLLGGLVEPTLPLLPVSIQSLLIKPKGNALDGACLLAENLFSSKECKIT